MVPRLHRLHRLAAAFVCAVALVTLVQPASTAHAATEDVIDSFTAAYSVDDSGLLRVTETIVYRFGSDSGRHGITRNLITRESYDDDNDQEYGIDVAAVASPSGDSAQYAVERDDSGSDQSITLRIGSQNTTITASTATYTISYTVTGALRNTPAAGGKPAYDELFWDVTGFETRASTTEVAITATVPGGAQEVSCFAGPVRSTTRCTSATVTDGMATFTQDNLAGQENVSVGVRITPGLVADNAPHLVPHETSYALPIGAGVLGVTTIGSIVGGIAYWRAKGRDQRYLGVPPGMVPAPGTSAAVGFSDPDLQIPVQFTPPRIPIAEAGLLIDGQVDYRETAATLVDLAVRGALVLADLGGGEVQVTLVDPSRATAPHEMVLMTTLFTSAPPGASVTLGSRGTLKPAHDALVTAVRNQVTDRGWFRAIPGASKIGGLAGGGIGCLAFFGFVSAPVLLFLIPLAPIVITVAVVAAKMRRGQRTADGRAVCDQVEGFKTYLATAEADQLKFEEGEDIFSRYLPWAMVFDLADRWSKICADLVAMGRIPDAQPYWYHGNFSYASFNAAFLYSALVTSASPVQTSSSTGTGFGGGSSFGGGGFSGGGGGGGGTGSW